MMNKAPMAHMMAGFNHDAARELIGAANGYDVGPMAVPIPDPEPALFRGAICRFKAYITSRW
jgi:hypothetical protein